MELESWDQESDCRSSMWWGGGETERLMRDCPSLNDETKTPELAGVGVKDHSDGTGQ